MSQSLRLTKSLREQIVTLFLHAATKDDEGGHTERAHKLGKECMEALRDHLLGKNRDAFLKLAKIDSTDTSESMLQWVSHMSVQFGEPPLEHLRVGKTGGEARIYRQTYFHFESETPVAIPYSNGGRFIDVTKLPAALRKKVTDAIVEIHKAEVEYEILREKAEQLVNSCASVKSLREKWPEIDSYVPELKEYTTSTAIGVTAAEIEAQLAKYKKAA